MKFKLLTVVSLAFLASSGFAADCLFGNNVGSMLENSRFHVGAERTIELNTPVAELVRQQIVDGMSAFEEQELTFEQAFDFTDDSNFIRHQIRDLETGALYTWFEFSSGDNPMGFVFKNSKLELVAIIGDDDFSDCRVSL